MATKTTNDAVLFSSDAIPGPNPGIPYILYYRQGSNPHPQFFIFFHASDKIREVVDRVKRHCELMNLRFVNVRPAIVNLDEAESKAYGGTQVGETA